MASLLERFSVDDLRQMREFATDRDRQTIDATILGELRRLEAEAVGAGEDDQIDGWSAWLPAMFPEHCRSRFAPHQGDLWRWVWSLERETRPEALIAIWNRGGAKSTSAELGLVAIGCRGRRRYALYVCETQDQADDHVGNIGTMLEAGSVERHYPGMASRLVGKFGNPKGWRRNRLRTASGFTIDALGLDSAVRGVKIEDQRPDIIVLDDIDNEGDSPKIVKKKIRTVTQAIIPAGSPDLAILGVQNLVHAHSIFAQLADGRADFLQRRQVIGPIPAIAHPRFAVRDGRQTIVGGDPTWDGLPIESCQQMLDDMGISAFMKECQHDVTERAGALWSLGQLARMRRPWPKQIEPPAQDRLETLVLDGIVRAAVGVDPSGGDTERSNEQGIVVCGLSHEGFGYVLADRSCKLPPEKWGARAVRAALDYGAEIAVEVNFGADMCISTVRVAAKAQGVSGRVIDGAGKTLDTWHCEDAAGHITIVRLTASRGKRQRAEPVAALYGDPTEEDSWEHSRMWHLETADLDDLETEMTTWDPDSGESPNRMDALVWAATRLMVDTGRRRGARYRG